jgi:hypothetical protein
MTSNNLTVLMPHACIQLQRLNTFRHSRVSQTIKLDAEVQDQVVPQPLPLRQVPDQREQLQFQAAKPEIAPYKRYAFLHKTQFGYD